VALGLVPVMLAFGDLAGRAGVGKRHFEIEFCKLGNDDFPARGWGDRRSSYFAANFHWKD
jgi:hypothetical protein